MAYVIPLREPCRQGVGTPNADGYRVLRGVYAHRAAYEAEVGPIPEGLVIDHVCRDRGCVEVTHLEVVTRGENVLRGVSFAAKNAAKTECPKGHRYTPENTIVVPRGGGRTSRRCRACQSGRRQGPHQRPTTKKEMQHG